MNGIPCAVCIGMDESGAVVTDLLQSEEASIEVSGTFCYTAAGRQALPVDAPITASEISGTALQSQSITRVYHGEP